MTMPKLRTVATVCQHCKPVFVDGVQDMNYRHPACHDHCERYKAEHDEILRIKKERRNIVCDELTIKQIHDNKSRGQR